MIRASGCKELLQAGNHDRYHTAAASIFIRLLSDQFSGFIVDQSAANLQGALIQIHLLPGQGKHLRSSEPVQPQQSSKLTGLAPDSGKEIRNLACFQVRMFPVYRLRKRHDGLLAGVKRNSSGDQGPGILQSLRSTQTALVAHHALLGYARRVSLQICLEAGMADRFITPDGGW